MIAGLFLLLPAASMILLLFLPPADSLSSSWLFIGRLHPLLLHFPIVLMPLVLIFEILGRIRFLKEPTRAISLVLLAASLSCIAVVLAGYLLYASGEYSGNLLMDHFRAGICAGLGVLVTTFLFFLCQLTAGRFRKWYLTFLLLTNLVIVHASHLGGSLTHGQDYLIAHLSAIFGTKEKALKPVDEMLVYEDLIVPFFATKCISCHNEHKMKGGYLMTSYQALLKGGESGQPGIDIAEPEQSELFNRVSLPADHEDHMPPEGKKPLTDHEIAILKFWITSGASTTLKVKNLQQHTEMAPVIRDYLPESARLNRRLLYLKEEKEKLKKQLGALAEKLQISIAEDLKTSGNFFTLSMKFPPATFTDEQLKALQPYFPVFTKVSLVTSDITDDDLYFIGNMTNLRKLYLQKTDLNGSGLVYLQQLPQLEILNLSFTEVDDASVLQLIKFPALKKVYLFDTPISTEVVKALRQHQPTTEILLEEGPYN
ncbi:c-type cytochrome domain-containing protein [Fulvivirgaceae bacterium BMA12]|uniref:C-type cytochrome domain-containing protein n=1 Tax=Agaribacillus aureus TaxID=3051825 RepID=A0ABT8L772_9BACT|nr:c-type cytochrome domain-containing protein [Fulvivirgaceae bacterium BMA12]